MILERILALCNKTQRNEKSRTFVEKIEKDIHTLIYGNGYSKIGTFEEEFILDNYGKHKLLDEFLTNKKTGNRYKKGEYITNRDFTMAERYIMQYYPEYFKEVKSINGVKQIDIFLFGDLKLKVSDKFDFGNSISMHKSDGEIILTNEVETEDYITFPDSILTENLKIVVSGAKKVSGKICNPGFIQSTEDIDIEITKPFSIEIDSHKHEQELDLKGFEYDSLYKLYRPINEKISFETIRLNSNNGNIKVRKSY